MSRPENLNPPNFQIRDPNPKSIPGPSPIALMQARNYYYDHCDGGFANPHNGQCFLLKTDSLPPVKLPENHHLSCNPDGNVDREWMHNLFDFK